MKKARNETEHVTNHHSKNSKLCTSTYKYMLRLWSFTNITLKYYQSNPGACSPLGVSTGLDTAGCQLSTIDKYRPCGSERMIYYRVTRCKLTVHIRTEKAIVTL